MRKRTLVSLGIVVVMVLLLALSCAPGAPKPVAPTEKIIKIGSFFDMTGSYSTIGVPIAAGSMDFWKFANEEWGGVGGIKVEEMWTDDKSDPSRSIIAYKRFKAAG